MKKIMFFLTAVLFMFSTAFAQQARVVPPPQGTLVEFTADENLRSTAPHHEAPNRAPGDVIFFENFTGTAFPPTGWTRILNGAGTMNWERSTTTPNSAPACALHSYASANLDGWLITPQIQVPNSDGSIDLAFYSRTEDASYAPDNGSTILVSTGTNQVSSFTLVKTLSENEMTTAWQKITLSLDAYKGESIYIAFRYQGNFAHLWYLDDVTVQEPVNNDLTISAVYPYSQVPGTQTLFSTLSATVTNNGALVQTNVVLTVELNGQVVGTSAPIASFASGATTTLSVTTSGVAIPIGDNSLTYTITQNETDDNPSDNTITRTFIGTDNTFATDNGTIASFWAGTATSTYGNIYTFTKETSLHQIQAYFYYNSAGTNANNFGVGIYEVTGENTVSATPIFSQTGFTKVTNATAWANANISPVLTVPAGSYYICISGINTNILGDANANGRFGYTKTLTGTALTPLASALFVRLIVDLNENDILCVANGFPYTMIPASQSAALPFPVVSGKAYNAGTEPQTNVKLSVAYNGAPLGTSTPIATLAPLATSANMTVAPPAGTVFPTTLGTNNVVYTVSQDEPDQNLANNTQTYSFNITEDMYAIDGPDVDLAGGGVGYSTANAKIGNFFTITTPTVLSQVLVAFSANNPQFNFNVLLHTRTGSTISANPVLSQMGVVKPATGGWITVDMPPFLMAPGDYFLCVQQTTTTNPGILYDGVPGRLCYGLTSGTGLTEQTTFGSLAIRMVIEDPVLVTITTDVSPAGAGTVAGGGQYVVGQAVTLIATGNSGYAFQKWSDEVTANPRVFAATEDATYTAIFEEDPCDYAPIGNGTVSVYTIPVNTYYNYSYSQQIFDVSEIGATEDVLISAISFQYSYATGQIKTGQSIFLGHTQQSTFTAAANYVPFSQLTQVFSGSVDYNNSNPYVTIVFDQPFLYSPTCGNLVVAVQNNHGTYVTGSNLTFLYHTATGNKTVHYYRDASAIDLNNPTSGSPSSAAMTSRNNVRFRLCPATDIEPEIDLQAASITGPVVATAGEPFTYTVTIGNKGNVPVSNYTVKVLTEANELLGQTVVPNILDKCETATVNVSVTFTGGSVKIKGRVETNNDINPDNDETPLMKVDIAAICADDSPSTTITGTPLNNTTTTIPFNWYYTTSVAQSIYLASEIDMEPGTEIFNISYNYVATTALPESKPIKVWIAHTNLSTLSAWLPFAEFTQVYEGWVAPIPATAPNIYELKIILDQPFEYEGGNLCVMTERVFHAPYTNAVYAQLFTGAPANRSRYWQSDGAPFVFNPPTAAGTALSTVPVINFYTAKEFQLNLGNIQPGAVVTLNPILCGGSGTAYFSCDDPCKYVSAVYVDGDLIPSTTSHTFTNVTGPLPIIDVQTAYYQYEVTVTYGDNGVILYNNVVVPNGGVVSVDCGSSPQFVLKPNQGYTVASLTIDGESKPVPANRRYTFINIDGNHTIHATFEEFPQCIISFEAVPVVGGEIIPVGREDEAAQGYISVDLGTNFQQFLFVPAPNYSIQAVYIDGVINTGAAISGSYIFTNIVVDHHIKVIFKLDELTILATAGANGSITPAGNVLVPYGTGKHFDFTPNTGYVVDKVYVNNQIVPTADAYDFTNVTSNQTIHVTFTKATLALHITWTEGGAVDPTGNVYQNYTGLGGDVYVEYNDIQMLTFAPAEGYKVSMVYVDGEAYPNAIATGSYTFFYVTTEHWLHVTFERYTYPITAKINGNGMINPQGTTYVSHGDDQTYTFYAMAGYYIANVFIDGIDNEAAIANGAHTFTHVIAPHTIDVITAPLVYTITAMAATGGSISPAGSISVTYGDSKYFTFAAASGYEIEKVLVDGLENLEAAINGAYAFINVQEDHTINVFFKILTFKLFSLASPNGSIYPEGITEVNYGEDITYTITPDEGYKISHVLVNGDDMGAINTYTFAAIEADGSIEVLFSLIPPVEITNPTLDGISIYSHTNVVYIVNEKQLPISDVTIFDMYGRAVWQGKVVENKITLDVANGIYTVRLSSEDQFTTTKVSISR